MTMLCIAQERNGLKASAKDNNLDDVGFGKLDVRVNKREHRLATGLFASSAMSLPSCLGLAYLTLR